MNISGIRPKQEFYAGMEKQEPEKKEMHRLNQVAIRMVEMPPLFSEEPMNGPAAAVKVMADTFRDYDREVVAVVNLRADMRPININIGPSELVGNIEGYPKLLQALQEISPVPVSFELIDGDAKGFYHLEDKKIVVQDGMSEVQTIKTLLHEMAHQKLHDKDNVPEAKDISRNGKEVEAESVAYVVCQHYGINTSDYSFSYVAGWSEGKETPELKASLDKIRQTASEFIYQIDQKMEVLMADKDQVQESAKERSTFAQELMDKITEGAKDLGFIPVVPETQEKTANPELKVVVDKALKDLDKKRTLSKVKESVKSKLKANTEKAEQAPKKSRTSKAKEERA